MATPDWLSIDNDEIILRLNPDVLTEIEQDYKAAKARQTLREEEVVYKYFNSVELLQVLASSVGLTSQRQGAIVFWTYYQDGPSQLDEPRQSIHDQVIDQINDQKTNNQQTNDQRLPVLRTLMNLDGDVAQKVCQNLLNHPIGDRILKAHSFIVRQISSQFSTVINDYVQEKLRPYAIIAITTVTVLSWCTPIQNVGRRLKLPEILLSNCWVMTLVIVVILLSIWWGLTKLPWQLPALPRSRQLFLKDLGKYLLGLLENPALQTIAIAVIGFLVLSWAAITFHLIPLDAQLGRIIQTIQDYVEPSLPVALISIRKLIISNLGKILMRYGFVLKFIFGRFIK